MNWAHLLVIFSLLVCHVKDILAAPIAEVAPAVYSDLRYSSCSSQGSGYYDSASQTCGSCGTGYTSDYNYTDGMGDYYQCTCAKGYYAVYQDCSSVVDCTARSCTSCSTAFGATYVSYQDLSGCTTCSTSVGADLECSCTDENYYLYEFSTTDGSRLDNSAGGKVCNYCPVGTKSIWQSQTIAGKYYYADRYSCQACPDPHMTMTVSSSTYTCSCASGYTQTGVSSVGELSCVYSGMITEFSSIEESASVVYYRAVADGTVSLTSVTIQHYYASSASRCKYHGGSTDSRACQALANLCVLQMYDSSYGACAAFAAITGAAAKPYGIDNWGENMPYLYYTEDDKACTRTDWRTQASLDNNQLRFVVASYTLNGTFNGFQELGTLFSYCSRKAPFSEYGGGAGSSTGWQYFGATESSYYQCDLDTLVGSEQLFYELYLYDPATTGATSSYLPIPVRIVDVSFDGGSTTYNKQNSTEHLCDPDDQLVGRFMLYDVTSGFSSSTTTTTPEVVRYAKNIILETSLGDDFYNIYTPILTIEFGESQSASWPSGLGIDDDTATNDDLKVSKTAAANTVDYYVTARYTMSMTDFHTYMFGFGIACVILWGLYAFYRYNCWYIRHNRGAAPGSVAAGSSLSFITEFFLIGASSWVYFFFPVHVIICWYFFTFFKLQSVPSVFLPAVNSIYASSSEYYLFTTNLMVMFIFHLVYCINMIWKQCRADIFFLDWEPQLKNKQNKVSVWRTLFVANEWAELQTTRKLDINFNLFWLAFFLIALDQQYVASPQPDVDDTSPSSINPILRFANTTWWWIVVSAMQYSWKFFIYERFFADAPEIWFIDFCTIAKISVLVLDEPFKGYYLHCRSPYQFADGTMAELQEMLSKEGVATTDRSLDPAFEGVQSFKVHLTSEFRVAFSKIYTSMIRQPDMGEVLAINRRHRSNQANAALSAANQSSERDASSGLLNNQRSFRAWRELTVFLQQFVENNFGPAGLRRKIRESTFGELHFDTPPDLSVPEQENVFLTDRTQQYTKTIFLGREIELLLMNILAFSVSISILSSDHVYLISGSNTMTNPNIPSSSLYLLPSLCDRHSICGSKM